MAGRSVTLLASAALASAALFAGTVLADEFTRADVAR